MSNLKNKVNKKIRKSLCQISRKTLKSQPILLKINCKYYKKTPKAEEKIFRYKRSPSKVNRFECDEEYQPENMPLNSSKKLQSHHLENLENFRRHFYRLNHQYIKSSLKEQSHIQITNIRLAPINESVQKFFMKKLNENKKYFPNLVYHGTKLENIQSILQYGFLIPNQPHPTNPNAPIIRTVHGKAFGTGIYSSRAASYSLSYNTSTNTLLGCAAIPKRDRIGTIQRSHGDILVLPDVSRIIPLFLIDYKYLNNAGNNHLYFNEQKQLKIEKKEEIKKSIVNPRKYLRKISGVMNDQIRKNDQYQVRTVDSWN